jgi:hypothetical protein
VPLVSCASDQEPVAAHVVTLLLLHVSVAGCPASTEFLSNDMVTEG